MKITINHFISLTWLSTVIISCTNSIKTDSISVEELIYEANGMHNAKNYSESIELLNQAAKIDPNNIQVYFNRAASRSALKDIDGSIDDCLKVIALDKNNQHALLNLGHHHLSKSDYPKAIQYFDRAQEANVNAPKIKLVIVEEDSRTNEKPDYSIAFEEITYYLGIAFMKNEEFDKAILEFESCVDLNAYKGDCFCRIAECYESLGDLEKACEYNVIAKNEGNNECDTCE